MSAPFPEPKQFDSGRCTMHQRSRIVIHQPTDADADRMAEALANGRLSEECLAVSCDVERFVAYVDNESKEQFGEVTFARQAHFADPAAGNGFGESVDRAMRALKRAWDCANSGKPIDFVLSMELCAAAALLEDWLARNPNYQPVESL